MSQFIVYKKEPCKHVPQWPVTDPNQHCQFCTDGHTRTEVDLVDVLRELGVFAGELARQGQELDMGYER